MSRRLFVHMLSALACCLAFAATAAAQDFQKTYTPGPNNSIRIENVSGDIHITGYEGSAVQVSAFKEGRDREMVEVEDRSSGGDVELRAKYPQRCNCDASVRFEVRVPHASRYSLEKISTASGNISVRGVTGSRVRLNTASGDVTLEQVGGDIHASTASGSVRVREAAGTVNASSASGDVDVEVTRLEGAGDMRFSTASGDVNVRLPSSLDARVHLSTASGSLDTNFPLQIEDDEHRSGRSARGNLGSGARRLSITSASGNVSLKSL
jgi:DUF4097 and DUF4098 domain-containing protein YvlB